MASRRSRLASHPPCTSLTHAVTPSNRLGTSANAASPAHQPIDQAGAFEQRHVLAQRLFREAELRGNLVRRRRSIREMRENAPAFVVCKCVEDRTQRSIAADR
jgi:hypothetical protein